MVKGSDDDPTRKEGFHCITKGSGTVSFYQWHGLEVRFSTRKGKAEGVWHFDSQKELEPLALHIFVGLASAKNNCSAMVAHLTDIQRVVGSIPTNC